MTFKVEQNLKTNYQQVQELRGAASPVEDCSLLYWTFHVIVCIVVSDNVSRLLRADVRVISVPDLLLLILYDVLTWSWNTLLIIKIRITCFLTVMASDGDSVSKKRRQSGWSLGYLDSLSQTGSWKHTDNCSHLIR